MTSSLRVRIPTYLDAPRARTFHVVANVYPADDAARRALPKGRRDVFVPAGGEDRYERLDLPPGRYLVEAALPSGELLSSEVDVLPGATTDLELAGEHSPHEWLDWQHLVGNVGSYEEHPDDQEWAGAALGRGAHDRRRPAAGAAPREELHAHWVLAGWSPSTAGRVWQVLADTAKLPPDAAAKHAAATLGERVDQDVGTYESDGVVKMYRFHSKGSIEHGDRPGRPADLPAAGPGGFRAYVLLQGAGTARLVSAPVPWIDIDVHEEVPFEVLVPDGPLAVNGMVRDPGVGAMLGYMSNGSLGEALRLVERAQDMLFHKVSNPLAAAAGAYIMLETERESGRKPWHPWVENLYEWFPWLPDGAVAYATLQLDHQEKDGDVDHALELLLEACGRGLPYFSRGLELLLAGLTAFGADPDYAHRRDAISAGLDGVRRVAARANLRQPFTTIQLGLR